MSERFYIDKVPVNITNVNDATFKILERVKSGETGYVCVTNVRATYFGNRDPEYCNILKNSFMTVPDGKPLEWFARAAGLKQAKKTSGPDLFENICKVTEGRDITHFFYGSTPEVIEKLQINLKKKYPKIKIVGAVSPPFLPVEKLANDETAKIINKAKPTFVWVGLGAPKQERFIHLIKNKIESSFLIGVGLVFDYQAGTTKRAPMWMQKVGLEWLYRHAQQPRYVNFESYVRLLSIIPLIVKAAFRKNQSARLKEI